MIPVVSEPIQLIPVVSEKERLVMESLPLILVIEVTEAELTSMKLEKEEVLEEERPEAKMKETPESDSFDLEHH